MYATTGDGISRLEHFWNRTAFLNHDDVGTYMMSRVLGRHHCGFVSSNEATCMHGVDSFASIDITWHGEFLPPHLHRIQQ